MKRKCIGMLLAVSMIAAMFTGCGNSAGNTKEEQNAANETKADETREAGEDEAQADAAGSGEPVTLRFAWWGSDARHEATLAAIERYCELHPNVTIEGEYQGYDGYLQKLTTQLSGKTEPDLLQLDYIWFPELAAQGDLFVDLGANENVDISVYSQQVLEDYCSINGKVISLPMGSAGFGAIINKNFYEKHNIPLDTEWTWQSMLEEGKRIHEENPGDYLLGVETGGLSGFVLGSYLYSKTDSYYVDEESYQVTASKEDLTEAFTVMKELFDTGVAQPLGEASLFVGQMEQNPKWINDEIGFVMDFSSTVGKYKAALGDDAVGVARQPYVEGGANKSTRYKPSMVLSVSNRSEHIDIATDFANWMMTDPEAVRILGTQRSVPTCDTAVALLEEEGSVDPDVAKMCEITLEDTAAPPPLVLDNAEFNDVVKNICEQVVYGQLTPEEAADKILSEGQAKLDSLKQAN